MCYLEWASIFKVRVVSIFFQCTICVKISIHSNTKTCTNVGTI